MKELKIPVKTWEMIASVNEQDGEYMVAIKPFCEQLGLDRKSQQRKITNDPRFRWGHMTLVAEDGRQRKMICLPVKQLNVWLCSINANRVTSELKDKLLAFQEECGIAIYNHFHGTVNPQVIERLMNQIVDLENRLSIHDQMLGLEASMAGKRLVAARHLKLVGD